MVKLNCSEALTAGNIVKQKNCTLSGRASPDTFNKRLHLLLTDCALSGFGFGIWREWEEP
ncbi:hypothetical protein [Fulvivirga kasyanovii]|uniref:hypothetical protein n=1 Tax=Fulvivirga kasyanovii TaxID=396812 RepID=UPI0031D4A30D